MSFNLFSRVFGSPRKTTRSKGRVQSRNGQRSLFRKQVVEQLEDRRVLATLASWDFFGESSPATSTAEIVDLGLDDGGLLTRGAGAGASSASNSFRTQGFQNNGISVANTDFFQTTLSADPGSVLSLNQITARFAGTASFFASPGVSHQFAFSLDGTTFTLVGTPTVTTSTTNAVTFSLSGVPALQNVTDTTTVTLRYFATGQTSTGGWGFSSPSAGTIGLLIDGTVAPAVDTTPPTLVSIDDGDGDNIVVANEMLTYTVTFSEDIDAATVTAADFNNAGTSNITIGTITESSPGIFSVQVTPTNAGTLQLRIPTGSVIEDVAGNDLVVPVQDDTSVTVTSGDVTPPTVVSITDDDVDDIVGVGATVTYTVTFSEDISEVTVSTADFDNAGTSTFTIGTISETSPGVFTIPVTATTAGSLQLRIPTTATIEDLASNLLVVSPPILDAETIIVDGTAPTLTSITDNISGGPGFANQAITFTVTFSEDINGATVTAADFDNAGTSTVVFGAISETAPGVFNVFVTPTSTGTVQLRIPTTAVISDVVGNNLDVSAALLDDTTITINAVTTLAVGDISIIGFNSNTPDGFAFVPWVDLLPGTVIKFTDNAFLSTGSATDPNNARGGENFATWTNNTGSTIAAGTVITIVDGSPATTSTGSVVQSLNGISGSGDNIFAYQGTGAGTSASNSDFGTNTNPTTFTGSIVFGLSFAANFLSSGVASSNTTYLPSELNVSNGSIALSTASTTRGQYTGARTSTSIASLKALVTNASNWTTAVGTGVITLDTTAFTVVADTTPPTVTSIEDNDPDDTVVAGETLTYTVTFSEDIDAASVTAADFDNAGTSDVTIGTITESSPGVFSVQVTPTTAGTLRLRIPTGSVIEDVAGNDLVVPVQDDTELSVTSGDITPPTVVSITDDDADDIVGVGATVTYTVTFSEDISEVTVSDADFDNAGTSTFTIGTISETSPGVFTIPVTATTAGSLQLRIPTTATIEDLASNLLVVSPPILDAETITVDGTAPTLASITDNINGGPSFVNQAITFTVNFSEDINGTTVTAADFNNAGSSTVLIGAISETSPGVFTVVVTPTSTGTIQLRIPTGSVISDLAGNNLVVPVSDDTTITVNAITTLAVGDISVIGYRTDAPDGLVFVTWVDLLPGTSINFWDSGYIGGGDGTGQGTGGGTWRAVENFATWTNSTGSTVMAGTVVVLSFPSLAGRTADLGSIEGALNGLSADGDQIFVGQGQFSPGGNPSTFNGTLVFGLDFNGSDTTWDATAANSQSSALPSVLNVATGNLAVTHINNGQYTGLREFTSLSNARTSALNSTNWTFEDTGTTTFSSTDFTVSAVAPTLTSVVVNGGDTFLNPAQRSMVTSLQVTFSAPVVLAPDAFSITNIGLFAASNVNLLQAQIIITPNTTNDVYTIRFGVGASVNTRQGTGTLGNSLADGNYRLTIDSTKVSNAGGNLTGNNVFGAARVDNFFRMYGDANGDGAVNALDRSALLLALAAANAALDFDGNGSTTAGVDTTNYFSNNGKRRRLF